MRVGAVDHGDELDPPPGRRRPRREIWTRSSACSRSPGSATGSTPTGACPMPSMDRVHAVLDRYAARARELRAERVRRDRDERRPRRGERAPSSWPRFGGRHGFETRLLSGREEAELTYRGVTSRLAAGAGDARLRHRRRLDRARARRPGRRRRCDEPRHRLRAHVGALPALRPAVGRRARRRSERRRRLLPERADEPRRRGWSASPAPSRRWRRSTSTWSARCPS